VSGDISFTASNDILNQIQHNIMWGQSSNLMVWSDEREERGGEREREGEGREREGEDRGREGEEREREKRERARREKAN
jgi:hypothetical protein